VLGFDRHDVTEAKIGRMLIDDAPTLFEKQGAKRTAPRRRR